MTQTLSPAAQSVEQVPVLCCGKWQQSTTSRWGEVFNPSSGKVIAKVSLCTASEYTVLEGPIPESKVESKVPSTFSRTSRLWRKPFTRTKSPPIISRPSD